MVPPFYFLKKYIYEEKMEFDNIKVLFVQHSLSICQFLLSLGGFSRILIN